MSRESEALTSMSPYHLLRELHGAGTGGLFTRSLSTSGLILGLSALTGSPYWNTALVGDMPRESLVEQAELIFRENDRIPSFYVPEEEQTEGVHEYLVDRGYKTSWTDAWMRLTNPGSLAEFIPKAGYVTDVSTRYDLDKSLDVLLLRGHQTGSGPEDPYGAMSTQELMGIEVAMEALLLSGMGHCIVVKNEADCSAEPVATATVAILGRYAYIANLATVPPERHKGYGKTALLAAAKVGYIESQHTATLMREEPVVCLATEPGQSPHKIFMGVGFEDMFLAHGYTLET